MRYDQFAKRILEACLAYVGAVETERETTQEPQTIDLWFVPRPEVSGVAHAVRSMPVLGSIARGPALIEPFHEAPRVAEIRRCIHKQLSVHQELVRANSGATLPMLWILAGGRPSTVINQLGMARMADAAAGVYTAPPGFRLQVVVLSELVRARGTLILRLLGAGRTFREALDELQGLPANAWEAQLALPWLVRYQFEISAMDPSERTAEEEAIMAAQKMYEEWERETLERGKALERATGSLPVLVTLCERRLGRPLREEERVKLAARLEALGSTRMAEVVLDTPAEELAEWIAGA